MTVFVCGGNETPGPRDACPDALHDHPLPDGYVESFEVSRLRVSRKWAQKKCRRCGRYGWVPPLERNRSAVR